MVAAEELNLVLPSLAYVRLAAIILLLALFVLALQKLVCGIVQECIIKLFCC